LFGSGPSRDTCPIGSAEAFDVFLAHDSADRAAVARIAERLRQERIEPWFDRWNLTPGERWQPRIVEGLHASKGCAVLIGPSGLGDWAREELAVAQDRAAKDPAFRLFMVLLPGAPDPMDPSLAFLTTRTWVDLRDGIVDRDGFQDLIAAVTGVARRPDVVSKAESDVCPYRGLESFDAEHTAFFYGREGDTVRVLEKLRASRFVAVIGASGSGKSSLVRAGVVPALAQGALPGSDAWLRRIFTPGARPLSMLAAQLARVFGEESMALTLDRLGDDERTLDLAVSVGMADRPPGERLVLVVDQFEEVFTLCSDDRERDAFLSNLMHAAAIPGGRVMVLIAMRADFYHHCATHDQLRGMVAAQQFLVGPLRAEDLRRVIEEPARQVGLEPEAGLVETILDDIAGRPGTLPLLSHVLLELWNARRGQMLTLEAYVANGGVEGALAARANLTYESLGPEGQAIARRVLLRLTQPGEGTEDTRRRAAMTELVTAPAERPAVESVVEALARERLVTVGTDEVSGAETVDVTHEALIRGWPLLQAWINEDRELLRAHRRLSEAAAEWEESGHDDALLYRGGRLAIWQDRGLDALNDLERRFLTTSRERESRERTAAHRRTRLAAAALVLVLFVVSSIAVVALRQRDDAADQRDLAYARQLAASAGAVLPSDPQLSLLLALESYDAAPIEEAMAALRQATLDSNVRGWREFGAQVRRAEFSPDGKRVALAVRDGTVQIWDWTEPTAPLVLRGHGGSVDSVAFSPDGNRVASVGEDRTVRIWDLASRADPVVLHGHEAGALSVAFSPDGRSLATAGTDLTIRVWDLTGQRPPVVLLGHQAQIPSVAFSPDGTRLVSSSFDATLRIWNATGGELMALRGHIGPVLAASFSPDATLIASGGEDSTIRMWDTSTGAELRILRGHALTVWGSSFSPDGRQLVSSSLDGTVRVWDWSTGADPISLHGHAGLVYSAAFSPDGRMVVSAGADARAQVWELAGGGRGIALRGHEGRVLDAASSSDGRRAVTTGDDGTVRVWDLDRPAEPSVLRGHLGRIYDVGFSPDDRRVISAGSDGTVRIWDLSRPQDPMVLQDQAGAVYSAVFSPDGRRVVTSGADFAVRVRDLDRLDDPVVLHGNRFLAFGTAFSPDGRRVASAGGDGFARVWDLARPEEPVVLGGHNGFVFSVAFSADGRRLVTGGGDGTVRVWDVSGRKEPLVMVGHRGIAGRAIFTTDGAKVISAGTDGTVRVWEPYGKAPPIVVQGAQAAVQGAHLTPEGRRLVSCGGDGTALVWDCEVCGPIDEVVSLARSRVVRSFTQEERDRYLR
jgi:WD40 repeat protein